MTIHYDSSIVKRTKSGAVVLSDTLEKGERLLDGSTYKDEEARLRSINTPNPFAQGSMVEHNTPENPAAGMTLDPTLTNTIREGDDLTLTGERGEDSTAKLVATLSDDGESTAIVPNPATQYLDPPKPSDSKQEWYDYAVKAKGHEGAYDDLTKNELIAQYGA